MIFMQAFTELVTNAAFSIVQLSNYDLVIGGIASGQVDQTNSAKGGLDFFFAGVDPQNGSIQWTYLAGGPLDDQINDLVVSKSQDTIYASGHYYGRMLTSFGFGSLLKLDLDVLRRSLPFNTVSEVSSTKSPSSIPTSLPPLEENLITFSAIAIALPIGAVVIIFVGAASAFYARRKRLQKRGQEHERSTTMLVDNFENNLANLTVAPTFQG
jgi:hypothetical protein